SFDLPTLDRVRHLAADVETGYLVLDPRAEVDGADAMSVAATRGHTAVHPWDPCVDAAVLARCAELGLRCNVWTVVDLDRAVALATLGVDGIVTNTPRRMVGALRPSG
ncbi:MAG: glycerophosphodiester phosphodiesterase, partial [Actinomycetes bacterium]